MLSDIIEVNTSNPIAIEDQNVKFFLEQSKIISECNSKNKS